MGEADEHPNQIRSNRMSICIWHIVVWKQLTILGNCQSAASNEHRQLLHTVTCCRVWGLWTFSDRPEMTQTSINLHPNKSQKCSHNPTLSLVLLAARSQMFISEAFSWPGFNSWKICAQVSGWTKLHRNAFPYSKYDQSNHHRTVLGLMIWDLDIQMEGLKALASIPVEAVTTTCPWKELGIGQPVLCLQRCSHCDRWLDSRVS